MRRSPIGGINVNAHNKKFADCSRTLLSINRHGYTMNMFQFTCPLCGYCMKLPETAIGRQGKYPNCAKVVMVTVNEQPDEGSSGQRTDSPAADPTFSEEGTVNTTCPPAAAWHNDALPPVSHFQAPCLTIRTTPTRQSARISRMAFGPYHKWFGILPRLEKVGRVLQTRVVSNETPGPI